MPLSLARKDPRAYTNSGAFNPDSFSPLFAMLFGLAVCLALITCLNIAGVEVTSTLRRSKVYVVQTTLGASRATLVRGVLLEGAMLPVRPVAHRRHEFVRTYVARLNEDRGFDGTNVIAIQVLRTPVASRDANEVEAEVLALLRSHPAVLSASGTARLLPGIRGGTASPVWLEGATEPAGTAALTGFAVDADYFATMRMRLLAGRFPEPGDSPSRIVVDESLAARFWPGGALGARFSTGRLPSADMYEIVGVAADVKLDASSAPMGGQFHITHHLRTPDRPALTYVVRLEDLTHAREVTSLVQSIAAGYTVRTGTMNDRYVEAYGDTRLAAGVAGGFGGIAFIVAMAGLYGVTAILVAGRAREIGIRLALGADHRDIRRLVVGPAVRGVALGLSAGVAGAFVTSRVIASRIELSSGGFMSYAGVVAEIVVTALVATWRPARQATSVDPAVTLRAE